MGSPWKEGEIRLEVNKFHMYTTLTGEIKSGKNILVNGGGGGVKQ